jgi:hypothetical protein
MELAPIMAYDDIKTEYHLTPTGWKIGDPPADRIETWICHKYRESSYSSTLLSWRCTWADPSTSRSARDKLRTLHKKLMGKPGRSGTGASATETAIGTPL